MSKPDAWMPLYIADYLADTQHLTRDEHGGYLLLLMAYWRNGGPLQDDDKRLAAIVKATQREWIALRATLAEFFTIAGGLWVHKRADEEHAKAVRFAEKQKANGNKGGRPKKTETETQEKPMGFCRDNPNDNPNLNPSESPSPSPTPKNKSKDQKPSPQKFADEDLQLAEWIFSKVLELNPTAKPPKLKSWAEDVRKIREIDKRRLEDIRALFAWANADEFWAPNILSPGKLRQKWDQLTAKQRARASPSQQVNGKQAMRENYYREAAEASERLSRHGPERDISADCERVE